MNIILLLIPLSLVLLALGVWAFFWAVNHSQFDDLDTPGLSPLADDAVLTDDDDDRHDIDLHEPDRSGLEREHAEWNDLAQNEFVLDDSTVDHEVQNDAAEDAESFDDGRW